MLSLPVQKISIFIPLSPTSKPIEYLERLYYETDKYTGGVTYDLQLLDTFATMLYQVKRESRTNQTGASRVALSLRLIFAEDRKVAHVPCENTKKIPDGKSNDGPAENAQINDEVFRSNVKRGRPFVQAIWAGGMWALVRRRIRPECKPY